MTDDRELKALKCNPKILELYKAKVSGLKKDGKQWIGRCPFVSDHRRGTDRNPSFGVIKYDDGVLGYHCFSCNNSGNIFQFICKTEGLTFEKAVEKVQEFLVGTWYDDKQAVEEIFHNPIESNRVYLSFPASSCDRFVEGLRSNSEARKFLESRRIDLETACRLKVGFRQSLPDTFRIPDDVRDKGWLLFPYIENETVVRLKARSTVSKTFTQQPGMRQKGLYNSNSADPLQPLYLVEGELDCLAMESAGFNTVSIANASYVLTPEDKDILMTSSELILAGDNDGAAGTKVMQEFYNELKGNVYLLTWPEGIKDANELLMKSSGIDDFRSKVENLSTESKKKILPGIKTIQSAMLAPQETNLEMRPDRFRFPWPSVDSMAICLPGDVIAVTASQTGTGKSQWIIQATLDAARNSGERVLNYQAEMSTDQIANIVTANILAKDRSTLTTEDYRKAADRIKDIVYYIGNNPDLTTSSQVLDLIELAVKRFSPTTVVLDHIHFICRNVQNEIQDQQNAMQRIKNMASKYGLKFFVIGQPRKPSQGNTGKEIHMYDTKGSETLLSDASVSFILHRPLQENYDPANPPLDIMEPDTKVTLHKARVKGKGVAACSLLFRGKIATFVDEDELIANIPVEDDENKEDAIDLPF